jgi:hypothetical protein
MVAKRIHCRESLPVWAVLVWAVILTGPANAITIRVPQDYGTIQAGIDAGNNGDEIVVSPGVYVENINFKGKNIVLRSTNPTSSATVAATIIDGNKKGRVVMFVGTETSSCVLSGFTIRNGSWGGIRGYDAKARIERNTITGNSTTGNDSYGYGGGLYRCHGTIQNNVITSNSARDGGGLCECDGTIQNNTITSNFGGVGGGLDWCDGTIQNNVITSNSSTYGGGLSYCHGTIQNNVISGNWVFTTWPSNGYGSGLLCCNGTIQNNTITGNYSAGGYAWGGGGGLYGCSGTTQNNVITSNSGAYGGGLANCAGTIQNNVISRNSASYGDGGGLYRCGGTIRNNTISGNSAKTEGGGLYGYTGAIVTNCIIWGNMAPVYSQISNHSIPNYSCIQGYTVGQGQGNIGADPRFVGPNDFHLLSNSPCIDAGTNTNCPATDKDGNKRPSDGNGDGRAVCDMGAYEYVGQPAFASVSPRFWPLYK